MISWQLSWPPSHKNQTPLLGDMATEARATAGAKNGGTLKNQIWLCSLLICFRRSTKNDMPKVKVGKLDVGPPYLGVWVLRIVSRVRALGLSNKHFITLLEWTKHKTEYPQSGNAICWLAPRMMTTWGNSNMWRGIFTTFDGKGCTHLYILSEKSEISTTSQAGKGGTRDSKQ